MNLCKSKLCWGDILKFETSVLQVKRANLMKCVALWKKNLS